MNSEVFNLFGKIGLDTKEADDSLDKTTKKAKDSTGKMPEMFKTAAKLIGAAFAIDKIIDFGTAAVEAAAAAQAISSQFTQVFGDAGTLATESLNKMAGDFGMLPNRLKGAFTTTTSMFKGLGLNTEDAMGQATKAVTLAADAAAFYDKSYEDANSALNSFIKGNYEGGESIGLFANDTQLGIWAAKNLGVEWKTLGEADKQMARMKFAETMQGAAGATGQAARESNTYSNQVGNLKQAWTDFKVFIGTPMMGTVITGLTTVSSWIQSIGPKITELTTWMNENKTAVQLIGVVLGTVTTLLIAYQLQQHGAAAATVIWSTVTTIATGVATAFGAAVTFLTSPIGLVILAIGAVIAIGILLYKNWDEIKTKAGQFGSAISAKFNEIGEGIKKPLETAKTFVKDMIDKIRGFFNFNWELPKIKMPHIKINGEFSLIPPKTPSFAIDWYKDGGIMNDPTMFGMNGNTPMVGGEAGKEAIVPLNRETLGMIGAGIVASSNMGSDRLMDKVDTLIEIVKTLVGGDPQAYQLLLDTGVLAGELTPIINKNLGRDADRKKRGG